MEALATIAAMFIRKTRLVNPKTKAVYYNFQLIESVRTERGPRQRILLNLGAHLDVNDEERKLLANRTEEILKGIQSLMTCPEKIERYAQHYASQLVKQLSVKQPLSNDNKAIPQEFVDIDVHSIATSEPRSVGAEHLMLQMAEQLELPKQLKKLGLSETETATAMGSVIARAVNPASERATYTWLCDESGLGELLNYDFKQSSLNKMYKISDLLYKNKYDLECHFEKIEQKFHGYRSTIALYDLTNVYMEGQAKANKKACFGVSKEKRRDCKLITMGLVINEEGFLLRTSMLPGNATEPQTLQEMIQKLSAHNDLLKPTIVLDAGISSEENLAWLRQNGYSYIVSARQHAPTLELEGELIAVEDALDQVKAALIKSPPESDEKWLYCESEAKIAVATQMKQSFQIRFEEDLTKLAAGLLKPKGRKKYVKIIERVGRLKEKHKKIAGCYEIAVTASEDGKTATAIEWHPIPEKLTDKLTGSYFLRTNLVHFEAKELWQLYNTLRRIEDAFRFMKSSLGLRPVYHQKESRVDGHLWITVMAYHLLQQCLYQLKTRGIHHHWETIRNTLRSRTRVTMSAKMKDGRTLYYRSTTQAEGQQREIYHALGLSTQILQARKTIV